MQTRQQSTLEVTIDFVLSILTNLIGQRLLYGTLATAGRMTLFAVVLLSLAFGRRFVTRRLFNAMIPAGRQQPRWHSGCEAISDTVLALLMAFILQIIFYGPAATLVRAGSFTIGVYGLTTLRRYLIRRIFVGFEARTAYTTGARGSQQL